MTMTSRVALPLALLLFAALSASAQERRLPPFVLGLGAGYDVASGIYFDDDSDERIYDQSSNIRSGNLSLIFPKLFMNGWGLTTGFSYGLLDLQADGSGERTLFVGGAPTTGTTQHSYHLRMRLLMMDLLTHIHIGGNARLEVGPTGGIGFLPSYEETETILTPFDARFSNGTRTRADSGASIEEGIVVSGALLRAGYEIPIIGGLALLPSVTLRGLIGIDPDGSVFVAAGTAGLGLSLLTGRTGGEEVEIVPVGMVDTVSIIDTLDPRAGLEAQVDLYSLDSTGRRVDTLFIALRRTLRRVEVPVESSLVFDEASAALPSSVMSDRSQAASFSEDDLVAMTPAEIRRRSLEVVASRMRDDRSLRLTVSGSRRRDEPEWFADARARAIRTYMQRVWDIDPSRIAITRPRDAGDRPAAHLSSRSGALLAPVVSEWVEQVVEAAPVGVQPSIVAKQGVQSWRVSVMQGSREVGVVRNTDADAARQIDIGMALRQLPRDEARREIGAELVVEDSSGFVTVARDRMEVVVDSTRADRADDGIETFVGEYLVPIGDSLASRRALERVVSTLPIDARVTVSAPIGAGSHVDRIGRELRTLAGARGIAIATTVETPGAGDTDGALVLVRVTGRR